MSISDHVERLLESVPPPMAGTKTAKKSKVAAAVAVAEQIDSITADELIAGMEKVGVKKPSQLAKLVNKGLAAPAIHTRTIDRILDGLSTSEQTAKILREFFARFRKPTTIQRDPLREARFARAAADAADMEKSAAIDLLENVWNTRHGSLAAFVLLYLNNKSKN